MTDPIITILTPTYNRDHTLPRLYDSLNNQSDRSFEWVLVDDGSTDGTADLAKKFVSDANFSVHYIQRANSGKHVAVNTGVQMAKGEWVFIVDSDDLLDSEAIAALLDDIRKYSNNNIVGVCYRRKKLSDGTFIGVTASPNETMIYLHPTDASRYFRGDLAYVFRKSALVAHPFPVIAGEKFVPELYAWNQIGDNGQILYFSNKAIYLCEYLPDGYSANFSRNIRQNPRGFGLFYRAQFFRDKSLCRQIKNAIRVLQCLWFAHCPRRPL